jgi:hypothetical protein
MKISTNLQYGYYVFLGLGDYHQPKNLNKNWIATWMLEDWKIFFENLIQLKATTLMIYLNGHLLPYKSHYYPELTDSNHPNVKKEFFSEVLSLAQAYGLNTIMVLTTTGHSGKYLEKNPDLSIKTRFKKINLEELLSPFPDHIRKTKNLAQSGSAQVGLGTLCHNNLKTQEYAINLIKECLSIYPQINGVALHPPESIYPCFCKHCCELFKIQYKQNMLETSDDTAREFYLESYLIFQKMFLEKEIKKLLPCIQLYTFTVPWLFEKSFKKISNHISKDTIIIDWDYNLNASRISQLNKRLLDYQKYGHQVWFMPTAGFGFDENKETQHQINKVQEQIEIAIKSKVSGIVHFVGPTLKMELEKTNFYYSPSKNHCFIRSKL